MANDNEQTTLQLFLFIYAVFYFPSIVFFFFFTFKLIVVALLILFPSKFVLQFILKFIILTFTFYNFEIFKWLRITRVY